VNIDELLKFPDGENPKPVVLSAERFEYLSEVLERELTEIVAYEWQPIVDDSGRSRLFEIQEYSHAKSHHQALKCLVLCSERISESEQTAEKLISLAKNLIADIQIERGLVIRGLRSCKVITKSSSERRFTMADLKKLTGMEDTRTIRKHFPGGLQPPGKGKAKTWTCSYSEALEIVKSGLKAAVQSHREQCEKSLNDVFNIDVNRI